MRDFVRKHSEGAGLAVRVSGFVVLGTGAVILTIVFWQYVIRLWDLAGIGGDPQHASGALASRTQPSSPELSSELDLIRQRQDDFQSFVQLMLFPISIFLGFVAAGGVLGLVFSIRNEVRAGQAHDLAIAGETAQQARSESLHSTLLDASEKTITLVNQTLELARDSTERATKTLSERAKHLVREVSEEISARIQRISTSELFETKQYKLLVEEPDNRRKLNQLADRLSRVEGYLEFQDIELEPTARFVKGMALHLNQDDNGAIAELDQAAEGAGVNLRVRLAAYYFLGYAQNNVGDYRAATAAFDKASTRAGARDPLRIEFARMAIESRFFEFVNGHYQKRDIIESVEALIADARSLSKRAASAGRANVNQLLGNMYLFLARETNRDGAYADALDCFLLAGDGLWAKFGQVEVLDEATYLGRDHEPPDLQDLEDELVEKSATRGEPRSIALLHLAIAKCLKIREAPAEEIEARLGKVDDQLREVDSDLRVYSLWARSNVDQETFRTIDRDRLGESTDEADS
jgi:hypothetical protein